MSYDRSILIKHDAFARASFRRWTLSNSDQKESCKWCGSQPQRLYSYCWESDAATRHAMPDGNVFCCFSCFSCYTF
jgi:hypothetical protein